jgi:ADP-ribose pyrophosphatase YjhB (NUDIX family)
MLYIQPNSFLVNNLCTQNNWQIHSKKSKKNHNFRKNNFRKNNFKWNTNSNKNKIKCGALVFNNNLNEIILVQNNYSLMKGEDKWGLPKGHREGYETYATCAKRELYEETGIIENIRDDMFKLRINNTYYFPTILDKNNVKLNPIDKNEIAQAKWIKLSELKNFNVNRETKIFIKRKLKNLVESLKNGI